MHFLITESFSVRSFPRIGTPRRIVYDQTFDKLIVATTKCQDSLVYSDLKLICPNFGTTLCSYRLEKNETIIALTSKLLYLFLGWEAPGKNYITLGTCGYQDPNINESYGRVIVLGLKSKSVLSFIYE